jgi:hypothetical protein
MTADTIIPVAASALVILSVVFSWRSFRFAEQGAAPDAWPGDFGIDLDFDKEIIVRGKRHRARWRARLLFNLAALCLAASVPLGYANVHRSSLFSVFVITSLLLLAFAACYTAVTIRGLWKSRRDDAFSAFYDGKKFSQFYRNREAMERLFFGMNPMPIWSIFTRDWEQSLRYPTAEQAVEANGPITQ